MGKCMQVCLACGELTYIRMLPTGEKGKVCEACQLEALSRAIKELRGEGNILKNILGKY